MLLGLTREVGGRWKGCSGLLDVDEEQKVAAGVERGRQKRPKPLSLLRLNDRVLRGRPGHLGPAGSRPMSNVNKGGDLLSENNAAFDLARANDRRVGA
jgi:hypothetical protein